MTIPFLFTKGRFIAFMTKPSKTLQKILSGSKNFRFAEFTQVLEAFGFSLERISGSHHIYSHPQIPQAVSVQPDHNSQAKPYQMRQFIKLIEKYALRLEDED